MAYIITEPCIGLKDGACVAVCPVDCIIAEDSDEQYYVNPNECIDCGACVQECPVNALYASDELPEEFKAFTEKNADYFRMGHAAFRAKYPPRQ